MDVYRRILRVGRKILKVILPILGYLVTFVRLLAVNSVIALWIGVPKALGKISQEWIKEAEAHNYPPEHTNRLVYPVKIATVVTIILEWIIVVLGVLWVIRLLI